MGGLPFPTLPCPIVPREKGAVLALTQTRPTNNNNNITANLRFFLLPGGHSMPTPANTLLGGCLGFLPGTGQTFVVVVPGSQTVRLVAW